MWKAALALLFALSQDPAPKVLSFPAPPGTDPKTLQTCAQQLKRRISEFGYKGVDVAAYEGAVKVSFDPGFTPAMLPTIERLATCRGQAFLWADMPLTDKEREQWIPGKTSPPGTSWLIDDDTKAIMDDSWKVPMDVRFERYQSDGGIERPRLAFSKAESKKFLDRYQREKVQRNFRVILDGKRLVHYGMLSFREQWDAAKNQKVSLGLMDWIPSNQVTDELLAAMVSIGWPMPVDLSRAR